MTFLCIMDSQSSSKGNSPAKRVYKMTPNDQTSVAKKRCYTQENKHFVKRQ